MAEILNFRNLHQQNNTCWRDTWTPDILEYCLVNKPPNTRNMETLRKQYKNGNVMHLKELNEPHYFRIKT